VCGMVQVDLGIPHIQSESMVNPDLDRTGFGPTIVYKLLSPGRR
jgi:hypothetical protein